MNFARTVFLAFLPLDEYDVGMRRNGRSNGRTKGWLKRYFIPHDENNHKPQILQVRSVVFVLIVALAVEGFFWVSTTQLITRSRLFGVIVVNALIDGTNQNRTANNESALRVSPLLTAAAQQKANDMAASGYFAHTSPSGLTPWYWFEKVGYQFNYAGENLAVDFSDSQDVTNAWMNSPEHRANILDSDFTEIGMATAQGTYDGHPAVFVVELFGTPASGGPVETLAAATTKPKPVIVTSTPTFVAVKAVSTSLASASSSATSSVLAAVAQTNVPVTVGSLAKQNNPIQSTVSNPRQIIDYVYLVIIALFALALILNIFIHIRIQHPQLILGGMVVILVAGLFIVVNQHLFGGVVVL